MSRTITDEQLVALMRDADPVTESRSPEALSPHEQRLLEQVLASDPSESSTTSLPHPQRRRVLLSVTSTGAVAAVATAAALILTAGSTPSVAFAGWTNSPTTPPGGQVQAAEAECQKNQTLASLKPTLVDTRGPYTLLVYGQSQGGTCTTGPTFAHAPRVFLLAPFPARPAPTSTAGPGGRKSDSDNHRRRQLRPHRRTAIRPQIRAAHRHVQVRHRPGRQRSHRGDTHASQRGTDPGHDQKWLVRGLVARDGRPRP